MPFSMKRPTFGRQDTNDVASSDHTQSQVVMESVPFDDKGTPVVPPANEVKDVEVPKKEEVVEVPKEEEEPKKEEVPEGEKPKEEPKGLWLHASSFH